jgi:ribonuclease HI
VNATSPHYLLFSESAGRSGAATRGRWRFVLESLDGSERLEAADEEPDAAGQRLDLLAVVRGLEAIDQPSRVTLVTSSSYVSRGIRFGLAQWRENDWMWERFGKMTPVKDVDLWRRVDQALRYHQVECRTWRYDAAHAPAPASGEELATPAAKKTRPAAAARPSVLAAAAAVWDRWSAAGRQFLTTAPQRLAGPLTAGGNLR